MARLCCSIEMEPRTLSEGQLNYAREAAVDIAQKMEFNKDSNAFMEGLRPVVPIQEMEQMLEREHQLQKLVERKETSPATERSYDCACTITTNSDESSDCTSTCADESPDKTKFKEPLSAPF